MYPKLVMLVRPPDPNISISDNNLPLPIGLGYLEESLIGGGIQSCIYDMFLNDSVEDLEAFIKRI